MASLFDFLFDTLPFAVAHHGAWVQTPPGQRTTIRQGLRTATFRTLRQQMLRLSKDRPNPLRGPRYGQNEGLWSLKLHDGVSGVGRGTCKVREQAFDELVVFEGIEWGREVGLAIHPSVLVKDVMGKERELPLAPEFLVDEWFVFSQDDVAEHTLDLYPLQSRLDFGLVRVFLFEWDAGAGRVMPIDPDRLDDDEKSALARYRRATAGFDAAELSPTGLDEIASEDLFAFDPFPTFEELALGGTIGLDEAVRFAVGRPRFMVATSIGLCRESSDFEPGSVIGFAKMHPNILVSSSTTLERIDAAVRVDRPARTTNLTRPGHCGCSEMTEDIRSLLVTDTNDGQALCPLPAPYWGNLFSYYKADAYSSEGTRRFRMVRPLEGPRSAVGYIERTGPTPGTSNDLTFKVHGQGDFDNIHVAPRMHLRDVTHVSTTRPGRGWRPIDLSDRLELDPIAMAPFCAHDCLHFHVRWSNESDAHHVLGWARDAGLVNAVASGSRTAALAAAMTRITKPCAEAGAPLVPPWQEVYLRLLGEHRIQISTNTVAPTFPGQREVLFHAPWAYGVFVGQYLHSAIGAAVTLGKVLREQVVLGRLVQSSPESSGPSFVRAVSAEHSWACLYWSLRYWSRAEQPGPPWYSFEYHTAHNLEGAITL